MCYKFFLDFSGFNSGGLDQWRIQKILVGGDDKNFKHKPSKIRMCCNQARSQKFAMEQLF